MALKDWPQRIRYTWTDELTGTPYSLVFDNPASAIAFIISQRNNLDDAETLLESLSDADTGESLAADSNSASTDDIVAVAPAGITIPDSSSDDGTEPVAPVSDATTATADPTAAATPGAPATVPATPAPADVPAPLPTDVGTQAPTDDSVSAPASVPADSFTTSTADGTTATDTPSTTDTDISPVSDAPTVSPLASSDPLSEDATVTPNLGTDDASDPTDDENTDFDSAESDRVTDDGPVTADDAPSIGTPTAQSPGVTGV